MPNKKTRPDPEELFGHLSKADREAIACEIRFIARFRHNFYTQWVRSEMKKGDGRNLEEIGEKRNSTQHSVKQLNDIADWFNP